MRILLFAGGLFFALLANADYRLQTVAEGLNYPWSIAFLPDGNYLVAMRSGEVRRISSDGVVGEPLDGLPESYVESQGGYFDVVLDPDFVTNQRIYLAFAYGDKQANATRIVSGTLSGDSVENVTDIYTASPMKDGPAHYGGKLQFLSDGTLLLTTGDGFQYREAAQDTFSHLGKIIRINADGSVPSDNPFADGAAGDPKVWSYGHRNPQGLVQDPVTGVVYMHEHGALGGDELNRVEPGKNYGWPAVTKGVHYSGEMVSPLKSAPGVEEPLTFWVPSIAASGLAIYYGEAFPEWHGDLFVGALVDKEVRRIELENGKVVGEYPEFSEIGERIRDVRQGLDGFLYILTDSDNGSVIRIVPAE